MLLSTSKYVHIKVTTKTEVVVKTAKSSVVKNAEDALRIAAKFNLEEEVQRELNNELLKSGISFDDCFSPEQLLTFY